MDELSAQPEVQGVCASCASVLQKRCQPRKVSGMNKDDLHTVVVQSQPSALPELLGYVSVRGNKMVQRAIAGDYIFFIFYWSQRAIAGDYELQGVYSWSQILETIVPYLNNMFYDCLGSVAAHGLSAIFTDIFTAGDGDQIILNKIYKINKSSVPTVFPPSSPTSSLLETVIR